MAYICIPTLVIKKKMNRLLLTLKRPFVWLSRIRYRCGYGVHSPFAYDLIVHVIHERLPYYAYGFLQKEQEWMTRERGEAWGRNDSLKLKRLLFRLVNRMQPDTVLDVGVPSAVSLYLQAAKRQADYTAATDLSELFLESGVSVDFLYLHDYRNPRLMEEVFEVCVRRSAPRSLFVIQGIGYSREMKRLWQQMKQHPQAGVTFDLYDAGLIFFDRSKHKQDYIVNF